MELKEFLAADGWIPSLPEGVVPILAELRKDEPDLRRINRLLAAELGLTVRILRLANSARYSAGGPGIGSIEAATAMLGLQATQQLVQAAAVSAVFRQVQGVNLTEFWRYSLNVAKLAQSLAEEVRLDKGTAFTAGLLHGAGDLILKMVMPGRASLQADFPTDEDRFAKQIAELGYAYPEVGAAFAARWQFPAPLVDAIRRQCEPEHSGNSNTLASVLFLACWSARAHDMDMEGTVLHDVPQDVADSIGVADAGRLRQDDAIAWTPIEEAREFA